MNKWIKLNSPATFREQEAQERFRWGNLGKFKEEGIYKNVDRSERDPSGDETPRGQEQRGAVAIPVHKG